MPNLIRLSLGHFVVAMGGMAYSFDRDAAGRFVAQVDNPDHRENFLSCADRYTAVLDLAGAVAPVVAAEPPADPNKKSPKEIVDELMTSAATPKVFSFALPDSPPQWYVAEAWPAFVPVKQEMLDHIDQVAFLSLDPQVNLIVTAINGVATYGFRATQDGTKIHLYELLPGSTFEELPAGVTVPAAAPSTAPPLKSEAPLVQISGIGPKVAEKLSLAGITTIEQIAALETPEQIDAVDKAVGKAGAVARGKWIEQAKALLIKE